MITFFRIGGALGELGEGNVRVEVASIEGQAGKRQAKINHNLYAFFVHLGLNNVIKKGKEASMQYYNNWVEEVKNTVPSEKLLIFSVKEGWEPLCKFLNVPIPEGPFPHTNDSAQMKKFIKSNQIKAKMVVIGAPILLGICAYFLQFIV